MKHTFGFCLKFSCYEHLLFLNNGVRDKSDLKCTKLLVNKKNDTGIHIVTGIHIINTYNTYNKLDYTSTTVGDQLTWLKSLRFCCIIFQFVIYFTFI